MNAPRIQKGRSIRARQRGGRKGVGGQASRRWDTELGDSPVCDGVILNSCREVKTRSVS